MKVNRKSFIQQLTTVDHIIADINSNPSNVYVNNIQSRKPALSMIWVEDANGKLTAQWTLQD